MSFHVFVLILMGSLLFGGDLTDSRLSEATIYGDYLAVRTADVWTGPCCASGEVNLTGKEGIMAWSVKRGSWKNVELDGLKVVAVVKANDTLGDPFSKPYPAKSVIITDERASEKQKSALVDFAKTMSGRLLEDVVWIKPDSIEMNPGREAGFAYLKAGDVAEIRTRALKHHDLHCGNEFAYYPSLTSVVEAKPENALKHRFLEKDWIQLGAVL